MGRAASFPEIQAKPVISPEERPPLFLIYVELWNMERAPRLHRGEQGLEGSLHRLRACDKGLIATVSPGSLRPAMEHSLWRFITVKSLEALRFFFFFFLLSSLALFTNKDKQEKGRDFITATESQYQWSRSRQPTSGNGTRLLTLLCCECPCCMDKGHDL